jgi:hypothetical protein
MKFAENIKRILSIVILICFFLPLAQCAKKHGVDEPVSMSEPEFEVFVPADSLKFEHISKNTTLAFHLWPLAFIAIRLRIRSRRSIAVVGIVEAAVAAYSLWSLVTLLSWFDTIRYGGIILISALVLYLLAIARTLYGCVRWPSEKSLQA